MDYSLEQEKEAISKKLPLGLKNKFNQCIDKIERGNYKCMPNFDEAYSAAINESSCQACIQGPNKEQIKEFIRKLMVSTR